MNYTIIIAQQKTTQIAFCVVYTFRNKIFDAKRRIVSNSVVNAKSDTTIDTIQVNSGIVVLYSI
jgi:hypothetical protein